MLTQLGLLLQQARERAGLTQAELSELSQVSARTIRDLEKGRGNIGIRPLGQLANVLGLKLSLTPAHE